MFSGETDRAASVSAAREAIAAHPERTVLVVNGDLPLLRPETIEALLAAHEKSSAAATLLTAVAPHLPDDPQVLGAYRTTLQTIGGEFEKQRAAAAIGATPL